jgi:hypothetical protein
LRGRFFIFSVPSLPDPIPPRIPTLGLRHEAYFTALLDLGVSHRFPRCFELQELLLQGADLMPGVSESVYER